MKPIVTYQAVVSPDTPITIRLTMSLQTWKFAMNQLRNNRFEAFEANQIIRAIEIATSSLEKQYAEDVKDISSE